MVARALLRKSPDVGSAAAPPRGVLFKQRLGKEMSLAHFPPSPPLARYVVRFWVARWDVPAGETREQRVIPHPCVNVQIEAGKPRVLGVKSRTSTVIARGVGRIVGVKLAPAAVRAFWSRSASELTDASVPIGRLFSAPAGAWAAAAELDGPALVAQLDALVLRDVPDAVDPRIVEAQRIHDAVAAERDLLQVDALARGFGHSLRSLQLLFRDYLGVSPKWLIMRYRMHEAAERIAAEPGLSLARLANELGYFDQAHFSRSFSQVVGMPPAAYAHGCRMP